MAAAVHRSPLVAPRSASGVLRAHIQIRKHHGTWTDPVGVAGTPANIFAVSADPGIFGVALDESIRYANVAISLTDDNGESFIYGYVPIVVAKCGVFLKEKGMSPSI